MYETQVYDNKRYRTISSRSSVAVAYDDYATARRLNEGKAVRLVKGKRVVRGGRKGKQ